MPDLTAVGSNLQWYNNNSLDTLVASGSPFATGDTAVGAHEYFVTQTVAGCEGPADSATLTIDPLPSAPLTTDTSICFGSSTPDFIAVGANIKWYDDSALTSLVFTGDTFLSGDTALGLHVYYATDSAAGCTGPSSMVTLLITAPPDVPVVSDTAICFGTATPDLIYVGTNTQWYDDAALTNLVSSADTFVTGDTTAMVHTYYVTDSTAACPESLSDTVSITINAIPAMPITSDTAVCDGDSVPSLIAIGTMVQWYSDSTLLIFEFLGDTFATLDSLPGSYDYFVTQTIAGCVGPADTVILAINSTPAPTSSDVTICYGDSVPDLVAVGTNITWYRDSLLDSLAFTGATFATGDTSIGVYTYYVRDSINGCPGPALLVTLSINLGLTAPPLTNDATSCYGLSNPALTAVGSYLQWYNDTALTNLIATGTSFTPSDTAIGTYPYYVTDSVGGCPKGLPDTAILTIIAVPAAPITQDTSMCEATPTAGLIASGFGIIKWYSDVALTNLVGTGDTLFPADSLAGTYDYYAVDSAGNCSGPADTATLTITTIPPAPVVSDSTVCVGVAAPEFVTTGSNIYWYSDSALTVLEFVGDTFTPSDTLVGIHDYFVVDSTLGCFSVSAIAVFTIDGSSQIAISDICFDFDSVIETTTSSDTLEFYNSGCDTLIITNVTNATGEYSVDTTGIAIAPGDTGILIITFAPLAFGTYLDTLIITSNASDTTVCLAGVGLGAPVISNAPDSFNLSYTGCCDSTTLQMTINNTGMSKLIYSIGSDSSWISFSFTNGIIAVGDSDIVDITFDGCNISPGNYTANIYLNSNDPANPVDTSFVVLTKDTLPDPPVSADVAVCYGNPIPDFTATSSDDSIVWYGDAALTIRLFEGDTFTAPDTSVGVYTYYITAWRDSCEGNADSVQLEISPPPGAPSVADTNACFGYPVPALVHAGTIVQWFNDTAMTNVVFEGDSFVSIDTAVGSYTYFLNDSTPGCPVGASDTVVLTIGATPLVPTGNDTTVCQGDPVPDLIAVGVNLQWYDDTLLDSAIFAGDTFSPGDTAIGVYRYYVTQTDTSVNDCESFPLEVVLTINGIPAAPSVPDSAICLGNPIPDFVATGTNITWYADGLLDTVLNVGDTLTLTPPDTSAGQYTYYVTDSVTACPVSPADTVIFTINAFSPEPTALDTSICFGSPAAILVAAGVNLQWYDTITLDSVIATGGTFTPGDTAVGTHTYYVTDSLSGCAQSNPDTSDYIIKPVPSAPVTADTTICFGEPTPDLYATGVEVYWYSDSLLDSLIYTGNPFNNNDTAAGTYAYYVTQVDTNVNACASPASMVTLTINAIPAAPTVSGGTVCEGDTVPNLTG